MTSAVIEPRSIGVGPNLRRVTAFSNVKGESRRVVRPLRQWRALTVVSPDATTKDVERIDEFTQIEHEPCREPSLSSAAITAAFTRAAT